MRPPDRTRCGASRRAPRPDVRARGDGRPRTSTRSSASRRAPAGAPAVTDLVPSWATRHLRRYPLGPLTFHPPISGMSPRRCPGPGRSSIRWPAGLFWFARRKLGQSACRHHVGRGLTGPIVRRVIVVVLDQRVRLVGGRRRGLTETETLPVPDQFGLRLDMFPPPYQSCADSSGLRVIGHHHGQLARGSSTAPFAGRYWSDSG